MAILRTEGVVGYELAGGLRMGFQLTGLKSNQPSWLANWREFPSNTPFQELRVSVPRGAKSNFVLLNTGQTAVEVVILNGERVNLATGAVFENRSLRGPGFAIQPGGQMEVPTLHDYGVYYDIGVWLLDKNNERLSKDPAERAMVHVEAKDPSGVELQSATPYVHKTPMAGDRINFTTAAGYKWTRVFDPYETGGLRTVGFVTVQPAIQRGPAERQGYYYTVPVKQLSGQVEVIVHPIGWTIDDLHAVSVSCDNIHLSNSVDVTARADGKISVLMTLPHGSGFAKLRFNVAGLDTVAVYSDGSDEFRIVDAVTAAQHTLPDIEQVAASVEGSGVIGEGSTAHVASVAGTPAGGDSFIIELVTF